MIDLAIINRGFRSQHEELLQFAEIAARDNSVVVLAQSNDDLAGHMKRIGRGKGVTFQNCKSYSNSRSKVIMRVAEAAFFMLWVFVTLLRLRPRKIYVSTDPPIIVAYVVAIYCRLTNAQFVYHVQDIHPEIANVMLTLNKWVLNFFKIIDNYTLRNADSIITLTEEMRDCIRIRSKTLKQIHLIENPGPNIQLVDKRDQDIIFCGNAGRFNHIPLLLEAIKTYLERGGIMNFTFAGGGIHISSIKKLSDARSEVKYMGNLTVLEAAVLVSRHRWALLPLEDEVTLYAFPSKSSTYVQCKTPIIGICGKNTSVGRWIEMNQIGLVCQPELEALVNCLFNLEKSEFKYNFAEKLVNDLSYSRFTEKLNNVIFS